MTTHKENSQQLPTKSKINWKLIDKYLKLNNWRDVNLAQVLGVTQPTVSYWRHGIYLPSEMAQYKLAKILGVSISDVIIPADAKEFTNPPQRDSEQDSDQPVAAVLRVLFSHTRFEKYIRTHPETFSVDTANKLLEASFTFKRIVEDTIVQTDQEKEEEIKDLIE